MQTGLHQSQQLRQQIRTIPEQIVASEVLQLPWQALDQHLQAQFEQNPALTLEVAGLCPACEASVSSYPCPVCGHQPKKREEAIPVVSAEDWESYRARAYDGEEWEPYATVAGRISLRDHLQQQWRAGASPDTFEVGSYLIDCLDDDGYLRDPLFEIAERFRLSVPQLEATLKRVQQLEPDGIAARDLRECLTIQCERARRSPVQRLAMTILTDAWDAMASGDLKRAAAGIGHSKEDVHSAVEWIREHLTPYPGRRYRDPWERYAPRESPKVAPDVIIRAGEDGFIVELVESSHFRLGVDTEYQRLLNRFGKRGGNSPNEMEHVRRSVASAKFLIEAVEQRRRTLYQVMTAVVATQEAFLKHGKAHLKPLLQKTIAAQVGLHESTVCRALADKQVQLPGGETIPVTQFFDDTAPVKEAIRDLIGHEDRRKPLSDSQLTTLLEEQGYSFARRTIAKYREALGIASVGERRTREPSRSRLRPLTEVRTPASSDPYHH